MRLLLTGLGLLLLSLLFTMVLPDLEPRQLAVMGWFTQATLYVGSALVVAGAVLLALRRAEDERSPRPPGRDWFA